MKHLPHFDNKSLNLITAVFAVQILNAKTPWKIDIETQFPSQQCKKHLYDFIRYQTFMNDFRWFIKIFQAFSGGSPRDNQGLNSAVSENMKNISAVSENMKNISAVSENMKNISAVSEMISSNYLWISSDIYICRWQDQNVIMYTKVIKTHEVLIKMAFLVFKKPQFSPKGQQRLKLFEIILQIHHIKRENAFENLNLISFVTWAVPKNPKLWCMRNLDNLTFVVHFSQIGLKIRIISLESEEQKYFRNAI